MLHFKNSIYRRTIRKLSVKVDSWSVVQALGEELRPVRRRGFRGSQNSSSTQPLTLFLREFYLVNQCSMQIEQESKNWEGTLNEMQNFIFFKFCYSVLYFLAYKLLSGKFGMHSLSLLHKTASGNVGTEAVTTPLKQQGHISGDVILILDENFFCRSPKNTLEETHSELMKMEICTRGCSAS